MEPKQTCRGFFCRREVLLPTWRGWAAILLVAALLGILMVRGLPRFLCVNAPLPSGGLLVVEGWERDHALKQVVAEFKSKPYGKLYVTGGPIEYGAFLSEYRTYAQRGEAVLRSLGLTTNEVLAVPSSAAPRDRTYNSAVALKKWFAEHGIEAKEIQLMTEGPHARRSRLLFEKAFGRGVRVGITSVPEPDVDLAHWWRTSLGFRAMVNEAVAYFYARFLFRLEAGRPGDGQSQ